MPLTEIPLPKQPVRDLALDHWQENKVAAFAPRHGYAPDLLRPRKYSEKLLYRILFDHDPRYLLYAVKTFVPSFLAARNIAGLRLARRYKERQFLTVKDLADLPDRFVVKSAFASGLNEIVDDKHSADLEGICAKFNEKLPTIRNAQGKVLPGNVAIFEEYLDNFSGKPPDDFKFHCFRQPDGHYTYILELVTDRFGEYRIGYFTEDYELLDLTFGKIAQLLDVPPPPAELAHLAAVAKSLAQGFDYVRVDLYLVRGEIYFGELTPFHMAATGKLTPPDWEDRLGALWHQTIPAFDPVAAGLVGFVAGS